MAAAGSATAAGVLVATLLQASSGASADDLAFYERRLPVLVWFAVVAAAAVVPAGILARWWELPWSLGLTLAGVGVLLPLWAAWPDLDVRWRTLTLAAPPLAVAGLAMTVRSWAGVSLGAAAAMLHAAVYDPFRDVGCTRICLEAPPLLPMSVQLLALLMAIGLSLAAASVVLCARGRGTDATAAAVGAVLLGAMAVLRWQTVGVSEVYAALLVAAVPVPGLVGLPAVGRQVVLVRRRLEARRLARDLGEDPEGLAALAAEVDTSLLTPGQQLAVRNAQLAAEARSRLEEVRASQRRIVAASDAERRRIERDLHDGIQQRLVGILMHLSGQGMTEVEQQVRSVLAELRTFSHGVFPSVLEDEGLVIAMEELAATSHAQLRLDVSLEAPVPPEHARAVYALVSQAGEGTVDVTVRSRERGIDVRLVGATVVDVSDVRDRFGALGGTITVRDGTAEGRLPCVW